MGRTCGFSPRPSAFGSQLARTAHLHLQQGYCLPLFTYNPRVHSVSSHLCVVCVYPICRHLIILVERLRLHGGVPRRNGLYQLWSFSSSKKSILSAPLCLDRYFVCANALQLDSTCAIDSCAFPHILHLTSDSSLDLVLLALYNLLEVAVRGAHLSPYCVRRCCFSV